MQKTKLGLKTTVVGAIAYLGFLFGGYVVGNEVYLLSQRPNDLLAVVDFCLEEFYLCLVAFFGSGDLFEQFFIFGNLLFGTLDFCVELLHRLAEGGGQRSEKKREYAE